MYPLTLKNRYTGDDSKDKEVLEELYGSFLLDAFVARMKRLLVFGGYFSSNLQKGDSASKKAIFSICKPCPNCRSYKAQLHVTTEQIQMERLAM